MNARQTPVSYPRATPAGGRLETLLLALARVALERDPGRHEDAFLARERLCALSVAAYARRRGLGAGKPRL